MAAGALAGDLVQAETLSLPAATAITIPSLMTRSTALFSALEKLPPRLMFTTAFTPAT
jgi:hypothetical protein